MFKKILKSGAFLILLILYKISSPFMKKGEIIVLMHHSIGPGDWPFAVKPETFRWQIEYLKKSGYSFISATELAGILKGHDPIPRRAILLSFDDGYRDFKEHALPILKEFNLPSIVFVHANRSEEKLDNNLSLLSWADIRDIKQYRVEIGNHSYSHLNLKTLSSEDLRTEIKKAEAVFQEEISEHPKFFAFPIGGYNQEVVNCLRENNYEMAFTINPWLVKKENDRLMLPRIGIIKETGQIEFMARTTRANDWYQKIVWVLFGGKPKK